MKKLLFAFTFFISFYGNAQPISTMPVWNGSLDSFYVPSIYRLGGNWFNKRILATAFKAPVMDVFLIAGQSNAKGNGNASLSPDPATGTVYQYLPGTLQQVTDEVNSIGSAWPSFGIEYNNLTGHRICFVSTAVNGTGQIVASDRGFGNWSPSDTLYSHSVYTTLSALSAIKSAGYTPVLKGILWMQGENDGIRIGEGAMTQSDYYNGLTEMVANYRTALGAKLPFYIFKIGTRAGYADAPFALVRTSQETFAATNPLLNKIVFRGAVDFPARGLMSDDFHFTQTGYNEMGRIGAENVLTYQNNNWQKGGENFLYYNRGYVGIGTSNPGYGLDVVGDGSDIVANIRTNSTIFSGLGIQNNNAGSSAGGGIRFYNDAGLQGQIYTGSSTSAFTPNVLIFHNIYGPLRLGSNGSQIEFAVGGGSPSASNSKMVLKQSGRIIMGENAVAIADNGIDRLQVIGNVKADTLKGYVYTAFANYLETNALTDIPSSTIPSALSLSTTVIQTGGITIDNSGTVGEITFASAGNYEIRYTANFQLSSSSVEVRIQKWNGSAWTSIVGTRIAATGSGLSSASNTYIFTAVASDKIRFGITASANNAFTGLSSGNPDFSLSTSIKKL